MPLRRTNRVVVATVLFVACSRPADKAPPAPPAPPAPAAPAPAPKAAETGVTEASLTPEELRQPADAKLLPSGVASVVRRPGSGDDHPADDDEVLVQYTLRDPSGKVLDSTILKQRAAKFLLVKTPPGWRDAFKQMVTGESARFWIPASQSFKPGTGPEGDTVLDVDLVRILKGAPPAPAPPDVAAAPREAKRLPSGLAIKVLSPGKGKKHAKVSDKVVVRYTGWTADGQVVDSSHGQAVLLPLSDRIKGWQEAVPRLVEGDRARIWIPAALAYQGRPGPQGMLVFDIELVQIGG